jgi:hypothetical protein
MARTARLLMALSVLSTCGCAAKSQAEVAEGVYIFASVYRDSMCLDIGSENVNENDDNVHRFRCNDTVYQKWAVRKDPSRPGRYLIEWSGAGNKFWTAEDHEPAADYLTWERRRDSSFQSWNLDDRGNGRFRVQNDGNSRCVDYSSSESGPNIRLAGCNNAPEQHWIMHKR